eukprot:TRINITY_DN4756_c0_g1_i1.p1 TRINITY_DN4756_c0_g1~~TRINITY_DN4756_c0_g1_i1.p1  ORF type:complete len:661 (+),score=122.21 TRINITY_DN4756_c0_g1_i1:263-1984(+)
MEHMTRADVLTYQWLFRRARLLRKGFIGLGVLLLAACGCLHCLSDSTGSADIGPWPLVEQPLCAGELGALAYDYEPSWAADVAAGQTEHMEARVESLRSELLLESRAAAAVDQPTMVEEGRDAAVAAASPCQDCETLEALRRHAEQSLQQEEAETEALAGDEIAAAADRNRPAATGLTESAPEGDADAWRKNFAMTFVFVFVLAVGCRALFADCLGAPEQQQQAGDDALELPQVFLPGFFLENLARPGAEEELPEEAFRAADDEDGENVAPANAASASGGGSLAAKVARDSSKKRRKLWSANSLAPRREADGRETSGGSQEMPMPIAQTPPWSAAAPPTPLWTPGREDSLTGLVRSPQCGSPAAKRRRRSTSQVLSPQLQLPPQEEQLEEQHLRLEPVEDSSDKVSMDGTKFEKGSNWLWHAGSKRCAAVRIDSIPEPGVALVFMLQRRNKHWCREQHARRIPVTELSHGPYPMHIGKMPPEIEALLSPAEGKSAVKKEPEPGACPVKQEPMPVGCSAGVRASPRFRYGSQLKKMQEMGYPPTEELKAALTQARGDVGEVVDIEALEAAQYAN